MISLPVNTTLQDTKRMQHINFLSYQGVRNNDRHAHAQFVIPAYGGWTLTSGERQDTTNLSIAELAQMAGYADQASLTHAMRKLSGLPPAAYRKQIRES